jgi:hypothetical protein
MAAIDTQILNPYPCPYVWIFPALRATVPFNTESPWSAIRIEVHRQAGEESFSGKES